MPYSGEGTEEEIKQRQEAARTHGAYAFERRGEEALTQPARSRLEELKEQTQTRDGVLEVMKERAANAVMMVELLTSYLAKEVKSGKPLTQISGFASLPAFMNTAQRALKDLATLLPDESHTIDTSDLIKKAVKDHERNT
jgi:hypothetical protein